MGERLFRWTLRLLPEGMRDAWGDELLLTFQARQRDFAHRWTPLALPVVWIREVVGLVAAAFRARRPGRWSRSTPVAPHARPISDNRSTVGDLMEQLFQDIRFALRTFARRPLMMGLAVVSLALGVGASTAMFSVVDSVLLSPLPFDDSEELVSVYPSNPDLRGHPEFSEFADRGTFAPPEVFWVAENQESMEAFGGYWGYGGAVLSGGDGPPERLDQVLVTPGLLPALKVEPVRGRLFDEEDAREGVNSVLLTEPFWESRYGRSPDAMGSTLRLDDEIFTVIGVLPEEVAEATSEADVWTLMADATGLGGWGNHNLTGAIGRLSEGATVAQVQDEVARLLGEVPEDNNHDHGASVYPRLEDTTRNVRPALLALIVAAFVLLAVGCGNVASILLGAGIDREQEIAVRSALGAQRARLTRQLLTESLVLAALGAVGGIALAGLISQGLLYLAPPGVPRIDEASLDLTVLLFAIGVSGVAGLLFGLVPAVSLTGSDLAASFKSSRGTTSGKSRIQAAVVVGELTLATVLLFSAALLGRTLLELNRVDVGLDTEGLYAVTMSLPFQRFRDDDGHLQEAELDGYFQQINDAVASAPGVTGVAVTNNVPLTGDRNNNEVIPEGWDSEVEGERLIAERRFVSDNYFSTTGVRIIEGRAFEPADNRTDAEPVVIISRGLARRVWPDEPAAGKMLVFWGRDPARIVGVAQDLHDEELESATGYAFYVPQRQVRPQIGSLLVRVDGDPATVLPNIRQRIWEAAPAVPITRMVSLNELKSDAVSQERYRARLMMAFAVLAAAFAMMGVYGVTARSVARRTREMGIRLALGAERSEVMGMVMKQGVRLAAFGVVLGIGISFFATRLLDELLFGVSRTDPLSLGVIALLVAGTSVAASWPPSRRATRVDPVVALREE